MSRWPDIEQVEVRSAQALWEWLSANDGRETGVMLITWKAAHPKAYVGREDVLDALVAHGWIDGRRYTVDHARTAQLITPRRTQAWAQSYKDRVRRLIDEGRMAPAGLASVEAGKSSGLWDYWADVDALVVPHDLAAALMFKGAKEAWEALAPSYRRNVLRWIKLAKTSATRAKRVKAAADATAAGEKLPQL